MPSIEKMLAYAKSQHHKVAYSMRYPERLGPASLDCSSFVYYGLIAGGFLPSTTPIGNTETLYKLKGSVLREIFSYDEIIPGDIFIRGREGSSAGAYGHTGIFLRRGEIIHCNARNNTVTINNSNSNISFYLAQKRSETERYFRPIVEVESKKGIAKVLAATNVRSAPSKDAAIVASYYPGDVIYYDNIIEANGYSWLTYIGANSGKRRYVAYKNNQGNQWMEI